MTEAARTAMDGENNVVDSKSEDFGRLGVEDFRNALNSK